MLAFQQFAFISISCKVGFEVNIKICPVFKCFRDVKVSYAAEMMQVDRIVPQKRAV